MKPNLGDDLLYGAKAIADYMFGDDSKKIQRRVYNYCANKQIPFFKMGSTVCAKKSRIDEWIEKQSQ